MLLFIRAIRVIRGEIHGLGYRRSYQRATCGSVAKKKARELPRGLIPNPLLNGPGTNSSEPGRGHIRRVECSTRRRNNWANAGSASVLAGRAPKRSSARLMAPLAAGTARGKADTGRLASTATDVRPGEKRRTTGRWGGARAAPN